MLASADPGEERIFPLFPVTCGNATLTNRAGGKDGNAGGEYHFLRLECGGGGGSIRVASGRLAQGRRLPATMAGPSAATRLLPLLDRPTLRVCNHRLGFGFGWVQ